MFITVNEYDKRYSQRKFVGNADHGYQKEKLSVMVAHILAVEDSYRSESTGFVSSQQYAVTVIHLIGGTQVVCVESREEIEAMILKAKG